VTQPVWPRVGGLRVLELGTPGEMRRWLNDLVLSGAKRATAGRLAEYEVEGEALEQPGERLVLVDDERRRVGLVQVDRVDVVPFREVPWEFAAAENEGDASIEEWREGHRRYWREADGVDVSDDEPIVLVWMHVLPADETEIRALIERWAHAVHAGDLDTVLADHADDIVMFDVPPPDDGVRGIDAYRETWPPFFEWQANGAVFEIVSLDVTAGDDVAFAHALLRCGTAEELERDPDNRLRLTLGLRKENGRWIVAHEHHSFPDKS
jgi:uncharacterized protein (TIGR02246 family)